ncbi:MAG TPA: apolipoprotein N-acyltransferase [Smithellaceae bacterium]|nr:apolipoprotein N-acyltransferase [Smithellaceae bacterium]HRS88246.1 apolipoprotein N-acyltransferase [Smithellaceae bacterium]HRV24891.1 apolipoprotein N-acyltransferase [Smithellaceae bacterium]
MNGQRADGFKIMKNIMQMTLMDIYSRGKEYLSKKEIVLAAISGIFLFLSFPKHGSGAVAWLSLVPLFFALRRSSSLKRAFALGFICGFIAYTGIIYWIAFVVVNYGYLPLYMGIFVMLLLVCYLSIYTALFAAGVYLLQKKVTLLLAAPALWVCLEYIKSYLFTGFPWENLGYSQFSNYYLIQAADIFGVFGLSFLVVSVNAAIYMLMIGRERKNIVGVAVVFILIGALYIYGYLRADDIRQRMAQAPKLEVSLVQGNIDQSVKWDDFYQTRILNKYLQLSSNNSSRENGLIVWPETALPFNYQRDVSRQKQVNSLSVETKSWFIFGAVSYDYQQKAVDFFNSAYLLSPEGVIAGRYDKVHLVPYGEYVPLRNIFPFIKKLTAGIGDFRAGDGYRPLNIADKKTGILICYEGILPHAARSYKLQSASLLVNITNDAWFGATSAPYQHFSMSLFRAIETRLYLLRSANTGISGIVDPTGYVVAQTKIFETDVLQGQVGFLDVPTFYAKFGDIFVAGCYLFIIVSFLLLGKGGRNTWRQKIFRKR